MRGGPEWFIWIETIGILSFAINAMIVARARDLSALGIFLCAAATALGGGTLRDILLGSQAMPFFWVTYPFYIVAIFALSLGYAHLDIVRTVIAKRINVLKDLAETIAFASLGGLGAAKAFNILSPAVGSDALSLAQLWILVSIFGAASAAFGSIIRDALINEFPGALRPGTWSLESLFIGSGVLAVLRMADVSQPWALLAGFLTILVIKGTAVRSATRKLATEKPA
jgi:uncharacterized membrane protein YeiH